MNRPNVGDRVTIAILVFAICIWVCNLSIIWALLLAILSFIIVTKR